MGLIAQDLLAKNNKLSELYPSYLDTTNFKYIIMDNMFVSGLLISNYENQMDGAFFDKLLALGIDMQISIFYEKQNSMDVLKKITYQIGNTGADIKNSSNNQIDMNIMNKSYNDAKYIREKLQIDGEELYYLCVYIEVYANTVQKLEANLKRVENVLTSIGLTR